MTRMCSRILWENHDGIALPVEMDFAAGRFLGLFLLVLKESNLVQENTGEEEDKEQENEVDQQRERENSIIASQVRLELRTRGSGSRTSGQDTSK